MLDIKAGEVVILYSHVNDLFVWFDYLRPIQLFFSYVQTGLPGLNQYWALINVPCSGTQCSDAGEAWTRNPSVSSQAFYHRAAALPHVNGALSLASLQ